VLHLVAGAVRSRGAAAVIVTQSAATAAIADRVLRLTADGLVEQVPMPAHG
jgi:putative ABC transport system ATP-binding protein